MVARIARALGALTIGVVTRPFSFEGKRRASQAEQGIANLREEVDTLIVIPNDKLLQMIDHQIAILDAFKQADQVLMQGVSGITDLITTPGLINLDFADVKAVMSNAGSALMGIGSARGEDRAWAAGRDGGVLAAAGGEHRRRPRRPPLHRRRLRPRPVRGLPAANLIQGAAHDDANIIFGTVIDDALGDEVRVTVIAAGFEGDSRRGASPDQPLDRPAQQRAATGRGRRRADAAVGAGAGARQRNGIAAHPAAPVVTPAPAVAPVTPVRPMPVSVPSRPLDDDLDVPDFLK